MLVVAKSLRGFVSNQVQYNMESAQYRGSANERHDPKRISQENAKTARDKTLLQKPHQRNKYLGCATSQIFGTLSQVDPRGTQTNGPKDKKTNGHA